MQSFLKIYLKTLDHNSHFIRIIFSQKQSCCLHLISSLVLRMTFFMSKIILNINLRKWQIQGCLQKNVKDFFFKINLLFIHIYYP